MFRLPKAADSRDERILRGDWNRDEAALTLTVALRRTRRPRIRSACSLRSLGSPLNARPLGDNMHGQAQWLS